MMRQCAFQPAQGAVRRKGQQAIGAALRVQGLQQVLQQRQGIGLARGGIAQHIVQVAGTVAVFFEAQPRHRGRHADDLADLAIARRQQIHMPVAAFEFGDVRQCIDQARIKIAAGAHQHCYVRAGAQCLQGLGQRRAIGVGDAGCGHQRFGVVDHQQQMPLARHAVARRGAVAHGFLDGRMQRSGLLQPPGQMCCLRRRKHRTVARRPFVQCARERVQHVAAAALRQVAIRHRHRFQPIQPAGLAQQRHHACPQQRGLAAAAGAAHQHQPAPAVQLRTHCGCHLRNGMATPEKHLRMCRVEGLQPHVRAAVRPVLAAQHRAAIILRKHHRGQQAIAAFADGFDKTRLAAVVAQLAAQLGDGLVHRVVAVEAAVPHLDQQLLGTDHFAGAFGQGDQHFHHARFQRDGPAVVDQRQALRFDQQRAQAEPRNGAQLRDALATKGHALGHRSHNRKGP